ncbi:MAG TPA: hypothetical protein VH373_21080 [Jatrophihabitantaceae bacterium]
MPAKQQSTTSYLQVMPFYAAAGAPHWNVFQVSEESPRITLAGTVTTCEQARRMAARNQWPLRIAQQAWQQMVAAGVAPNRAPDGLTII